MFQVGDRCEKGRRMKLRPNTNAFERCQRRKWVHMEYQYTVDAESKEQADQPAVWNAQESTDE